MVLDPTSLSDLPPSIRALVSGDTSVANLNSAQRLDVACWAAAIFTRRGHNASGCRPLGHRYGRDIDGRRVDYEVISYVPGVAAATRALVVDEQIRGSVRSSLLLTDYGTYLHEHAEYGRKRRRAAEAGSPPAQLARVCSVTKADDWLLEQLRQKEELLGRIVMALFTGKGNHCRKLAHYYDATSGEYHELRALARALLPAQWIPETPTPTLGGASVAPPVYLPTGSYRVYFPPGARIDLVLTVISMVAATDDPEAPIWRAAAHGPGRIITSADVRLALLAISAASMRSIPFALDPDIPVHRAE